MKFSIFFAIITLAFFPLKLFAQQATTQYPFIQESDNQNLPPLNIPYDQEQYCLLDEEATQRILQQVELKNPNAIKILPECLKLDRKLMLKVALIDPAQFQYASEILKEDENFVRRMLKVNPAVLQYVSLKLRYDKTFMEQATYLNRDALQYADIRLLDNRLFMKKMIAVDSRNYMFASDRLKEVPEFIEMAFSDNGLLLAYAPYKVKANKKFVKIALKSNSSAIEYVADEIKDDEELQELAKRKTSIESKEALAEFLYKNYIIQEKKKNLGFAISNRSKFSQNNKIIERNYITKWQRNLNFDYDNVEEDLRLIAATSRNYPVLWKEDLHKYPDLIKKITKFFANHNIDRNTIDNLSVTYLTKVKTNPLTLVLNLYLLRDSKDIDLGPEFVDVTSLTIIAQKQKNIWRMTVVEVIFDSEIKVDVSYENGHRKYILWDLYTATEQDKNPKIIFKVEDKFRNYFEIFEEQSGGKYQMIYRIDPLEKNPKK